jgi:hypothetical protein
VTRRPSVHLDARTDHPDIKRLRWSEWRGPGYNKERDKQGRTVIMEFDKASEQNAWNDVEDTTRKVRAGDVQHPGVVDWFRRQGVDPEHAVFPALALFDDGVYFGTLVDQDRRVFEYFVDLEDPDDGEFEDVTAELGPKEPGHAEADITDLITMALVYYDHRINAAA